MSKPVEIEFLMKDKLSDGIDNANAHIDTLIDNAKKAAELVNAKIAEQHKVIDGVASDLSRMERQLAGMKPGTAQKELAADVMACRKVLDEERNTLVYLEKQHRQAEKAVSDLEKEHGKLSESSTTAAVAQKTLAERIAESKDLVKYTTSCIKELEKAYKNAAPGNAQSAALAELNAAKKALEEEKLILASLTREQEENRESNKRLAMQLRELQNAMAKMRLEGKQDTEEYREMAEKAALLSDTISDLHTQTKILSNDDANLQGFMSGISGLSGMFTAATGAVSLFASENENLAKIQARVQSVMAVTMGLQQVFNTLNKDSAFRLVTVVKMKNLLTAANARLAASLGISTAAASALMATLTLGLSAVITGLIVLFNKYSDAQEEARQKAQDLIEVESEGRAQMIKTRFEIDNTIRELKEFTGSKEEEKKKTEELNRKYGEAFGYYDTVAEWYDVLTQKAADYIQMLFLQAKAQALVNKAVEADDKVNKLKATDADDVDGSMGWFKKSLLYFAQGESKGQIDASAIIKEENEKNKEQAIADAEKLRDDLLKQAEDLTKEMGEIGKNSNIGGHSRPEHKPIGGNGDKDRQKELEREKAAGQKRAEELARLRQENEQESIDQMAEGSAKRIRQIKFNYQKEESEIKAQEAKWRDAQGGNLTEEQGEALAERLRLAQEEQRKGLEKIDKESLKNELQAMVDYLREYGTLQEQKYAIAKEYAEKIREVNEGDGTAEEKRWQVRKLEKERDAAVSQTNAQNLALNIDWSTTFEGVGNVLKDVAKETLAKIEEYMQTSEFKKLSAENKKVYTDLQAKLKDETGGNSTSAFNFKIWDTIAKNVKAYQDSVRTLREKTDAHTQAVTDLEQAQQDLADATDDASKEIAQKAVDIAQGKVDATAASQNEAQEASDKARKTLTDNTICGQKGVYPKVIASTATIRRAKEQCSVLYNREVVQFPAPGLDAEDSFFAKESAVDYEKGDYGRKYVGIMPSGKTKAMMEIRTMAALMQKIYTMDLSEEVKDKLWTLTVYFNSLKDLGKASTLVDDDVKDFIVRTANRMFTGRRLIVSADELTSRVSTTALNETLDKLEKIEYSKENEAAKRYASNVLLATNMISVGIDVARLNVMLMIGQPKLTSEYIQASSRVGRSFPGVVFVQYDATKSRDRSHYERFRSYHESFYRFVEPTGATPFSRPARERALHAVLVSMMRQMTGMGEDRDAINFDKEYFADTIKQIETFVTDRVTGINERSEGQAKDDVNEIRTEIEEFFDLWQSYVDECNGEHPSVPLYFGRRFMVNPPAGDARRLLKQYNSSGKDSAVETLTSMRNVDTPVSGSIIVWGDNNV